jgi:peptide/nickel transport system permease protein
MVRWLFAAIGTAATLALARRAYRRIRQTRADDPGELRRTTWRSVALVVVSGAVTAYLATRLGASPRAGFIKVSDGGLKENLTHVALPVITLAITETAVFTRVLRNDLITTLSEDFVLSARAKGMTPTRILVSDALRPSLFTLVTLISVELGRLLGGAVIVETIYNLPGMGRLLVDAIVTKNYTVVQGCVLVIAIVYLACVLVADLMYVYLDPRVRRARV